MIAEDEVQAFAEEAIGSFRKKSPVSEVCQFIAKKSEVNRHFFSSTSRRMTRYGYFRDDASPLFAAADRIRIPLLTRQGANHGRVKQSESEQLVEAIEKNGGTATYVLYPDEGHGFVRPANRMDFLARVERLLAEHAGGRYEPMEGDRIAGWSAIVK